MRKRDEITLRDGAQAQFYEVLSGNNDKTVDYRVLTICSGSLSEGQITNIYFVFRDIDIDCGFLSSPEGGSYRWLEFRIKLLTLARKSPNHDTLSDNLETKLVSSIASVAFALRHVVDQPSRFLEQEGYLPLYVWIGEP